MGFVDSLDDIVYNTDVCSIKDKNFYKWRCRNDQTGLQRNA